MTIGMPYHYGVLVSSHIPIRPDEPDTFISTATYRYAEMQISVDDLPSVTFLGMTPLSLDVDIDPISCIPTSRNGVLPDRNSEKYIRVAEYLSV